MRPSGQAVFYASMVLCWAALTSAQPRDRAAADALFQAGRAAMAQGNYEEACPRFEESHRLDPAVGTVLNLATCKEKLGDIADAWQLYREAIDRLPHGDDRIAFASERVRTLEPKLAYLELRFADEVPPETLVIKNGLQLGRGSLGVPLVVNPGEHVIVVRATGHADNAVSITLGEGDRKELRLQLGAVQADERGSPSGQAAAGPAAVKTPDQAAATTSDHSALGYVLTGIGAAGVVASVVAGAIVLSQKQAVEDNCEAKLCNQEGVDAGNTGKTFSTIGTISFAVGVASLGAGMYFLLTTDNGPARPVEARSVSLRVGGRF